MAITFSPLQSEPLALPIRYQNIIRPPDCQWRKKTWRKEKKGIPSEVVKESRTKEKKSRAQ
jgi:hypothetical protein